MSDPEFDRWLEDLGARFPAVSAWIRNLGTNSVSLLAAWAEALSDIELHDALEVNRRMMNGDDPGPGEGAWKWQELPAHVRGLARAVQFRGSVDSTEPDRHEPRYKCPQCRDKGYVTVASREATKAMFERGNLDSCRHRVGTVLCTCDAGQVRQKSEKEQFDDPRRRREKTAVVSEWWFIAGTGDLTSPEQVAEFGEWCQERKEAWFNRKRHSEFDQYNQREFSK